MAVKFSMRMFSNRDEEIIVNLARADGEELNLNTATIAYAAKRHARAATKTIEKTTANGGIVPTGASFSIFLDPADTLSLNGGYYHEAKVTLDDGVVFTAFTGRLTIDPSGV